MLEFFHTILTQPLLNVLVLIYNAVPGNDMGIAIIILTILIRLVLYPSFQKSLRAQKELQELQPKINEIREKHKGDKEAESRAIMEFYQKNKINPFSSCLPLLLQLPILIALYQVFLTGLNGDIAQDLYGFVRDPGTINTLFLGFIDLASRNLWLALVAGALQFVQTRMIQAKQAPQTPQDTTAKIMSAQMTYIMPVITVVIAARLPAGLAVYWAVSTLFAIAQQYYIIKVEKKNNPA